MGFHVQTETRPARAGIDGTVYILADTARAAWAEICPALGFNCFRWQAPWQGKPLDLLYAGPDFLHTERPTRGGIPILFPFPNRIAAGRFSWQGKDYELPRNDSGGKNAIHGFTCRDPWRVVGQDTDDQSAWITGEFWASRDGLPALAFWPADYRIRVTYRLHSSSLRVEALVENPDRVPLPFGLGYHPYFRIPLAPGGRPEDCWVQAKAHEYWELVDSLPTGVRRTVDPSRNLTCPRRFPELTLDDVLTGLEPAGEPGTAGLYLRGGVGQSPPGIAIQLLTSPPFRELVVFTPPHREAVCLEPYTCSTDAINLQQRGIDAGLLVLRPGESWLGVVEMVVGAE